MAATTITRPATGGTHTQTTHEDGTLTLTYTDTATGFCLDAQLRPGTTGYARVCGACQGTALRPEYRGVYDGVCFPCHGTGLVSTFVPLAQQRSRLRSRVKNRLTTQAQAERAQAENDRRVADERAGLLAAHPEFAAALDQFETAVEEAMDTRAEHLAQFPGCHPGEADAVRRERAALKVSASCWALRTDFHSIWPHRCDPDAFVSSWRQDQARAQARHLGEVGQTLTVTGTVTTIRTFPTTWGSSTLYVLEGTGDAAGANLTWFSSARWLDQINEGDTLTVTGTVKKHTDHDQYGKSTQLTRPRRA